VEYEPNLTQLFHPFYMASISTGGMQYVSVAGQ